MTAPQISLLYIGGEHLITVVPAKSDSDVMFCLLSY